jgi:crotonobetainyl-CoA:carnitine CoA-transferase CaiB-like acyl-CoA transferase
VSSSAGASRPLEGVRIVAFTQFLLGPAAVQYLADLGADVIKIEGPAGAWERTWSGADTYLNDVSVFFLLANRNCRSVTLDLKSAAGVQVAKKLIASADVVLENFRPGVMERFGLDYDSLHEQFPELIYASASGYGATGDSAKLPGQDLLLQAMTGLAAHTGSAPDAPIPAGAAVVDQHGAALLAMGVMGALLHRHRTGEGQQVSVTMIQAALDLQTEPITYHLNGGAVAPAQERVGSSFHPGPYGLYPTTDGHVAISLSPVAQVLQSLGATAPELSDPAIAFSRRDDIRRTVAPLIAELSTAEALSRLRAGGVWSARVNDYDQALAEPAVAHLDPVMEVQDPRAGDLRLLRHPVNYSAADTSLTRNPPALGEHTDEVLTELGADEDAIAEWRRDGAFGSTN